VAVDKTEALAFIADNHRAVLATSRADGRPQLSLVAAGTDGDAVVVSTRHDAMKARNLRLRPYASLVVFTEAFYGRSVQVEGPAEIVELPDAMEGLVAYYRQVAGEHPDWDDYRRAMEREARVLLRITVARAGPNRSG
jgi:PPOX class probable F420-dependent enzyme